MDEITPKNKFIIIIGLDGEITLQKKVQNDYKFEKGQSLLIKVYPKRMIIQKFESLEEILNKPTNTVISIQLLNQLECEFD